AATNRDPITLARARTDRLQRNGFPPFKRSLRRATDAAIVTVNGRATRSSRGGPQGWAACAQRRAWGGQHSQQDRVLGLRAPQLLSPHRVDGWPSLMEARERNRSHWSNQETSAHNPVVEAAYYQELIRPLVAGRRVVLCGQLLNGSTALVETLRALGAERCLVLAHGIGTGRPPSPDDADQVVVEPRSTSVIQEFREVERLLARPPAAFLEALARFAPAHRALTLAPPISIGPLPTTLDGRRFFGRRAAVSLALEDKVAVDAFWDRSGVARAPSAIVPPTLADVAEAASGLDRGQGVVVAADAREGIHGGGEGLRWARDDAELAEATDFLRAISDRVRVMPFLEGIPCSIHGIVFPDHVVAVRPVEMVTLRQPPRLR